MADRIEAEATVIRARSHGRSARPGEGKPHRRKDVRSALSGKTTWDLLLEVRSPKEPPYQVQVRTKQPHRRLEARGAGTADPAPGLVLPVTVDLIDPTDVEVHWEAFADRPEVRQQVPAAEDAESSARPVALGPTVRRASARFEQNRALVLESAQAIADGVRAGTRQPGELEDLLETNVPVGLITAEEAEALRHAATGREA